MEDEQKRMQSERDSILRRLRKAEADYEEAKKQRDDCKDAFQIIFLGEVVTRTLQRVHNLHDDLQGLDERIEKLDRQIGAPLRGRIRSLPLRPAEVPPDVDVLEREQEQLQEERTSAVKRCEQAERNYETAQQDRDNCKDPFGIVFHGMVTTRTLQRVHSLQDEMRVIDRRIEEIDRLISRVLRGRGR